MFQLCLKRCLLCAQLALEGAFAHPQPVGNIINAGFPTRKHLHERTLHPSGVAIIGVEFRKAALQLRFEIAPHAVVVADKGQLHVTGGKRNDIAWANLQ